MFRQCFAPALLLALGVLLSVLNVTPRAAAQSETLAPDAEVTYTVDDRRDYPDATPADKQCLSTQGTCTLRAAIQQANWRLGKTTIIVPTLPHQPPLLDYYEIGGNPLEDNGATGDLDIYGRVHLIGDGVTPVMQTAGFNRIFDVFGGAVIFEDMVIQYGYTDPANSADTHGGGIRVNIGASLVMTNGLVSHNNGYGDGAAVAVYGNFQATNVTFEENQGNDGGAIYNAGTTTLTKANVRNNNAAAQGGGIYNSGALTLQTSTVQGNLSQDRGGGIYNNGTLLTNKNTIIDNNGSGQDGGGIYSVGTTTLKKTTVKSNGAYFGAGMFLLGGTADVQQSAFHDNQAMMGGGGILVLSGAFNLNNSTVSKNYPNGILASGGTTQLASVTIAFNNGAGIYIGNNVAAKMKNSLLAENTTDCDGEIQSQNFNLIGNTTNCVITGKVNHNQINLNPHIGLLANNGGPTLTHALNPNSPAIDRANGSGCKTTNGKGMTQDQRGKKRHVDGDNDGDVRCDIGAYEYHP